MKILKAAFLHTIPVLMGYIFMGSAFGILLTSKGYHFGWAALMSILIYAGSMQFVAISLLTNGFHPLYAAMMTLLVNARHIFYGLSMLDKFKMMGKKKPYMIFSLTDETFSLLCSVTPPEGVDPNKFSFYIAALNHLYWITGCVLGGVIGSLFTFNTKGIDFVMTALFVVIFVEQWESNKNHIPALVGIIGSLICLVVFGGQIFVVPAMAFIVLSLTAFRKNIERKEIHVNNQ